MLNSFLKLNEYEYKTTQGVRKVGNDYEIDIDPGYEYVVLKYSDNVTYGEEVSYFFASTYATDPYDDYRPVDDPFDGFPFCGVSLMYFNCCSIDDHRDCHLCDCIGCKK